MKKWKDRWNVLLPYEKKFEVASLILLGLGLVTFLVEVLDKFGVLPVAIDMFLISKGILAAAEGCEAVVCWRKERNFAHACIMMAIWLGLGIVWDIVKLVI